MKTRTISPICLAVTALFVALTTVHADTTVAGGPVSGTWDITGSPYIVESSISVAAGTQLSIDPGVVVRFRPGAGLSVNAGGTLSASGSPTKQILFTSDNAVQQPGDWTGIQAQGLAALATVLLSNCQVEYATRGVSASCTTTGTSDGWMQLTIENTTIRSCSDRGLLLAASGSERYMFTSAHLYLSVVGCNIYSNSLGGVYCWGWGGDTYSTGDFDGTIGNNTISGNGGNGIEMWNNREFGVTPNIVNNTIWGNAGRGLDMNWWITRWIENNIVVSNAVGVAGSGLQVSPVLTYNDVWGNGTNWAGDAVQFTNATGNISADPLCVNPAGGDFQLLPGSPCIDQGTSAGLTTDQRGLPRAVDLPNIANADGGDGTDIGAFELQDCSQTGPVFTVNATDDVDKGVPGVLHCSLREAINAANATPGTHIINLAVTGTITLTNGELVITNDLTIIGPGATNLTVSGNNASRVCSVTRGQVLMSGLTIANGNAGYADVGGGIKNLATIILSACTVTASQAGYAGGIYNAGSLTISNSTISSNSVPDNPGGGIASDAGTVTVVNSSLVRNSARYYGGAIFINTWEGIPLAITNSTISGNSCWGDAGGIFTRTAIIVDSTITANYASYIGGGVFVDLWSELRMRNTLVAGNGDGSGRGPDCFTDGSTLNSSDYNLIQNTNGCDITGVTAHNIYGQDPLLGPLADNGGLTVTHALLPGSPAIDQGNSGGLATDQRGQPRIFNFPAYFNADDGCDIGAYELQERPQTGPVFTVNTTDDVDDGVPGIAHCSLREAINAANSTLGSNTITFATAVPGLMAGVMGAIVLTNGQLTVAKNNELTILGPGSASLMISGNHSSRILQATVPLLTVNDLTFTDGYAPGQPNYKQSSGGAISSFNSIGVIIINRCLFKGNIAGGYGGAVFQNSGFLEIAESAFQNNMADGGGAIVCLSASVNRSCMFSNTANDGGALIVYAGEKAGLTNCTIAANTASGWGGGIGCWQAGDFGGMVFVDSCTISSNNASAGGGVCAQNFPACIRNSIIAGNRTGSASSGQDIQAIIDSGDFNLIQDTNGCTINGVTTHNIYNQDPKLGALADLGGPTPTHALRFDSPAIDAGNSGGLSTDQRGLPRTIDDPNIPNADSGDGTDIGAYEADSILRITRIAKAGSDIQLQFNSVLGRDYRLERADDILGPWSVLSNNIVGTGGCWQAIDTGATTLSRRFYRAVLVP